MVTESAGELGALASFLCGKLAWRPLRIHGSMFFLDIGAPLKRAGHRRDHGEWSFTFEQAKWSFESQGRTLVSCEHRPDAIDQAFSQMSGGTLSEVVIDARGSVCMRIGDDLVFKASQCTDPELLDDDQWCLFVPGDMVWVARKWQVACVPATSTE